LNFVIRNIHYKITAVNAKESIKLPRNLGKKESLRELMRLMSLEQDEDSPKAFNRYIKYLYISRRLTFDPGNSVTMLKTSNRLPSSYKERLRKLVVSQALSITRFSPRQSQIMAIVFMETGFKSAGEKVLLELNKTDTSKSQTCYLNDIFYVKKYLPKYLEYYQKK